MVKYVLKRAIFALFALFILLTIIFFLMSLLPFSPVQKDPKITDQEFQRQLEILGLNKPIFDRYLNYWDNFFHGNLGLIYNRTSTTIQEEIFPRLPNTMYIAFIAYILAIFLGFVFGFISALYRGKWQDTLVNIFSVIFISVPSFVVGILLLKLAGAIGLPLKFLNFGDANWNFGLFIQSSIMPVLSLTFGLASTLTYYVRNEVVDILNQDYIKTAKSKGMGTFGILFKHIFRNASIPVLSILGPGLLAVVSGSIVLEQMYGVSGMATILVNSIQTNQVNLVMFQALFLSSLYFLISIALDVVYTIVDPRIKIAQQNNSSWTSMFISFERRIRWHQKLNNLTDKHYEVILQNSAFYNYLMETNAINHKHKTILVEDFCYNKYNLKKDTQYLILGKSIFNLKKEEMLNNG